MRHLLVTRVVVALTAMYLAFSWAFAKFVRHAGDTKPLITETAAPSSSDAAATGSAGLDGARLFGERCGACHEESSLADQVKAADDPAARLREFGAFLTDHGDATAEEDAAILARLAALAAGRGPSR